MNIIGIDSLVFGVDDVRACCQYLTDYGLQPIGVSDAGGRFEALDGTCIVIAHAADTGLPAALGTASMLRQTVYGVSDENSLLQLFDNLCVDRPVTKNPDGSLDTVDDLGFAIRFQVTVRRVLDIPPEGVNAPGSPVQRGVNVAATTLYVAALPRSLSHVVYFVPDVNRAEAFYVRLGFRVTDRLDGAGPFLRPAGTTDHHCLFLIQTPPHMKGCEHFTFHLGGPTELLRAGTRFVNLGYQSFWGPGRHIFGSNWFWYFNSPLGCHVEYDADMDQHDDMWVARTAPANADNSQIFLFESREKWFPSGPPPNSASTGASTQAGLSS